LPPCDFHRLKDSDVTWLYGPLHTAADPVPPPKVATTEERYNLVNASGKKPILKHRSIWEALTIPMPSSPVLEVVGLTFGEDIPNLHSEPRPVLQHTKSDTNIFRRTMARRESPPRIGAGSVVGLPPRLIATPLGSTSGLPGAISDSEDSPRNHALSDAESTGSKRHISFNTFVEQRIAIEKRGPSGDEEGTDDDQLTDDDGDEEEDDDVLEMRTSSSVSSKMSGRPSLSRQNSADKETMTIARMPPTLLKTDDTFPGSTPAVVFVPPPDSGLTGGPRSMNLSHEAFLLQSGAHTSPALSNHSSSWGDDDDDYGVGFDYFGGAPDFGVGDEYDSMRVRGGAGSRSPYGHPAQRRHHERSPIGSPPDVINLNGRAKAQSSSPPPDPTGVKVRRVDFDGRVTGSRSSSAPGGAATDRSSSSHSTVTSRSPPLARSPPLSRSPPQQRSPPPQRGILKNGSEAEGIPVAYNSSNLNPSRQSSGSSIARSPDASASSRSVSSASTTSSSSPPQSSAHLRPDRETRGRSVVRTPSSIAERERSSSRNGSSPVGSISPSGSRPGSVRGGPVSSPPTSNGRLGPPSVSPPMSVAPSPPSSTPRPAPKPPNIKLPSPTGPFVPPIVIGARGSPGSSSPLSQSGASPTFPPQSEAEARKRDDYWSDQFDSGSVASTSTSTVTPTTPTQTAADANYEYHSTNPTPSNSPVTTLRSLTESTSSSSGNAPRATQEDGKLVGRAAGIVTSARGFLGAVWNAGIGSQVEAGGGAKPSS
jgi:hypothetical protein